MNKKILPIVNVTLSSIVGGGQTIATMEDGCKLFVWGGLPEENVNVQITKKKSKLAEGFVTEVVKKSKDRVEPVDKDSYLSTSPWQIMSFDSEQKHKAELIESAYQLHGIKLPKKIDIFSDNQQLEYRNKVEFSWYYNKDTETTDLAFFRRGTHGKIPVSKTSLAKSEINRAAQALRDIIREKEEIKAFMLKTLLVRCDQNDNVSMQLYVKDQEFINFSEKEIKLLDVKGFDVIYSNPKCPASVITKVLQSWGKTNLSDTILDISFSYAVDGFFQINIPVYEETLRDIKKWTNSEKPVIDLYSGVGTIGLTVGGSNVTLVEINELAVTEIRDNVKRLDKDKKIEIILSSSEKVIEIINKDSTLIVDPPRAGLHNDIIDRLLEVTPERIIYLSCNPATQARDVAQLSSKYAIKWHRGYNFFPRTPHIEHLIILDLI